jgi:hypothetical protein
MTTVGVRETLHLKDHIPLFDTADCSFESEGESCRNDESDNRKCKELRDFKLNSISWLGYNHTHRSVQLSCRLHKVLLREAQTANQKSHTKSVKTDQHHIQKLLYKEAYTRSRLNRLLV